MARYTLILALLMLSACSKHQERKQKQKMIGLKAAPLPREATGKSG